MIPICRYIMTGVLCGLFLFIAGCEGCKKQEEKFGKEEKTDSQSLVSSSQSPARDDKYQSLRESMVRDQIEARRVKDKKVLEAMRKVPRHWFVPADMKSYAYQDRPLPIGFDQTISQPYIVAYMTEALQANPDDKVLEIGTGSGYQAAVLAETVDEVYSIEIICELEKRASNTLSELGYDNVHTRCADGYKGWPEHAPFDAIIVTAAPGHVPEPLVEQLAKGGNMVIPVGDYSQKLYRISKTEHGVEKQELLPVRFVPMTGEAEEK